MDRTAWLQARATSLGSSEVAAVLGLNPYRSPFAVYTDKRLALAGIDNTLPDNEPMRWGRRLEPVIAEAWCEERGLTCVPNREPDIRLDRHPDYPFLTCTVDADILGADPGVLEVKTAGERQAAQWEEDVPLYYQVQLQHQLLVTGRTWGSIAALLGGQRFLWKDYARHDVFLNEILLPKLLGFWGWVEAGTPPPADDTESTREALQRLYPREQVEAVALAGSFIDVDAALQEVKAQMAELTRQRRALENEVIAALGDAAQGVLPNGVVYTYKTQRRAAYSVEAQAYRVLRRLQNSEGSHG